MDKVPEFDLMETDTTDITETCPIKIKSGEFEGIIYRYGKISFQELENDGLNVTMDIDIIFAPENFDKTNTAFTQTVGNIFMKLLEEKVEADTIEKDLEADVHEDVDNT